MFRGVKRNLLVVTLREDIESESADMLSVFILKDPVIELVEFQGHTGAPMDIQKFMGIVHQDTTE